VSKQKFPGGTLTFSGLNGVKFTGKIQSIEFNPLAFTPLGAALAARASFNSHRMATEPGEPEYLSEKVMAIFLDGPAKDIFVWIPSAAGRAYEVFDLAPKQTIYKADPRSPKGLLLYRLHRIN
jgi:hypothetical protein